MKYRYEELSVEQYEKLVVTICQSILGIGAQGFTKGPDGGRDAVFDGTAENYPSKSNPWKGRTIIQAKHTNGINKKFSDIDFYNPNTKKAIIDKEIPKIQGMKKNNQLDNYMLFSNRKLTGNAETNIKKYIANQCGILESSIALIDIDQTESYIKRYKETGHIADIDPIDSPFQITPDELADLIEAIKQSDLVSILDAQPVERVSYEEKNRANDLDPEYEIRIRTKYLKDTNQIRDFLAEPENSKLLEKYELATEEINSKIISKRRYHQNFSEVIEYIINLLIERDTAFSKNKKLTRTLIFYMYWNCDIGIMPQNSTQPPNLNTGAINVTPNQILTSR